MASALLKSKPAEPIIPLPRSAAPSSLREPAASYRVEPATQTALALETAPEQAFSAQAGLPRWFTPPFRFLGQIERAYLVFEASGGLFVLDQHAAAERILFEKFLSEVAAGRARSQKLMLPMTVELPASAVQKVLSLSERLERLGFSFAASARWACTAWPCPRSSTRATTSRSWCTACSTACTTRSAAAEAVQHDAVATIACKAAVKAHDALSSDEALRLVSDLKDCRDGSCCPHGRRTMLALSRDELARRFQRPGAPPL